MSRLYYRVDFKDIQPEPVRIGCHGYYSRVIDDDMPGTHVFEDGAVADVNWDLHDVMYVAGEDLNSTKLREIINTYRYFSNGQQI